MPNTLSNYPEMLRSLEIRIDDIRNSQRGFYPHSPQYASLQQQIEVLIQEHSDITREYSRLQNEISYRSTNLHQAIYGRPVYEDLQYQQQALNQAHSVPRSIMEMIHQPTRLDQEVSYEDIKLASRLERATRSLRDIKQLLKDYKGKVTYNPKTDSFERKT